MSKYKHRVGYAKLGRSFPLDPWKAKNLGGDIDVCRLLDRLARQHPDIEFVIIGRNQRENPQQVGYPENVTNPWIEWWPKFYFPTIPEFMSDHWTCMKSIESFRELSGDLHKELDALVLWAGQHGSVNSIIPKVDSSWNREDMAMPQYAFAAYGGWLLDFVNRWKEHDVENREEIWLNADVRNYLKCRDLKWPLRQSVISQYEVLRRQKHERYGDWTRLDSFPEYRIEGTCIVTKTKYEYLGLDHTTLPSPSEIRPPEEPGKYPFGAVMNEAKKDVKWNRREIVQDWILDHFPDAELRGTWSGESLAAFRPVKNIQPVMPMQLFDFLRQCRTSLTTPTSGSGWPTSKMWECFAVGAVCFLHPKYDDQCHFMPKKPEDTDDPILKELTRWLRVPDKETFAERAKQVQQDDKLWEHLAKLQRTHWEQKFHEWQGGTAEINKRLKAQLQRSEEAKEAVPG